MTVPRTSDPTISDDALGRRVAELESRRAADGHLIAVLRDELAARATAYAQLEGAIATSRRIGAAVGIVMSALRCTEDDAFHVLVRISQRQNRKVRLVADDVVLTGTF